MSVRNTLILNRSDLKYLLIDSLRLYSDNVVFIDGNNPYRFSINKKTFYVLIKNVHESGDGRENQDECRIQISKSKNFNAALNSKTPVIVLGYFADEKVFTAWNPYLMRDRFNQKKTISLYSRFSIQRQAAINKIAVYIDSNDQAVLSFLPDYLGLYLENLSNIHLLNDRELTALVEDSDDLNSQDQDGKVEFPEGHLTITHTRYKRDPKFKTIVYDAYENRCAMCGIQLELTEAAHIVPHSHEKGTDEIGNGISLCALHHTAYDRSLIFFDEEFNIQINERKMEYLEKMNLDSGFRKFKALAFDKIQLPTNHALRPNVENIKLANRTRGISISK
ncbi:MAG TPA: HNH endonuclease [Bacteroidia bacterium]|jgi:putative restriction endonuclease|nr:HNH endonuclease [Bacteroidia bacterium]